MKLLMFLKEKRDGSTKGRGRVDGRKQAVKYKTVRPAGARRHHLHIHIAEVKTVCDKL